MIAMKMPRHIAKNTRMLNDIRKIICYLLVLDLFKRHRNGTIAISWGRFVELLNRKVIYSEIIYC
jgi:hypothetical protein